MCAFNMACPSDEYVRRRAQLAAVLSQPLCLFAGDTQARNYTGNYYPFRAASTYRYFGGPAMAGAVMLIEPGSDGRAGVRLFRHAWDVSGAVWVGDCASAEAIASAGGFDCAAVHSRDALVGAIGGQSVCAVYPPSVATVADVAELRLGDANDDVRAAIVNMRLIKDEHEVAAMRRAADIGIEMHLAAGRACADGVREMEIAAAIYHAMIARGARPAFTPIATRRGEILHPEGYPNRLQSGDLMLVDAGAEEPGGYASDMTRVFPVSGTFEPLQKEVYETVLRAQERSIDACVVGARFRDIHDLAARTICEGLVDMGFLAGDPNDLLERRVHTLFFPHGLGHLIGMDVHDMEDFGDLAGYAPGRSRRSGFGDVNLRLDRDLEAGMAVTIEPGIYFIPAIWANDGMIEPFRDCVRMDKVGAALSAEFGGVRIEDDVVVGKAGPEVLTARPPKSVADVEALMAG